MDNYTEKGHVSSISTTLKYATGNDILSNFYYIPCYYYVL